MLVAFGATANHCALYLMSSSTVEAHKDELKDYDTSKGTIRFQADKPLPAALVRKLVKARIAENGGLIFQIPVGPAGAGRTAAVKRRRRTRARRVAAAASVAGSGDDRLSRQ